MRGYFGKNMGTYPPNLISRLYPLAALTSISPISASSGSLTHCPETQGPSYFFSSLSVTRESLNITNHILSLAAKRPLASDCTWSKVQTNQQHLPAAPLPLLLWCTSLQSPAHFASVWHSSCPLAQGLCTCCSLWGSLLPHVFTSLEPCCCTLVSSNEPSEEDFHYSPCRLRHPLPHTPSHPQDQLPWPPCCSWNMPGMFPPQGLCT